MCTARGQLVRPSQSRGLTEAFHLSLHWATGWRNSQDLWMGCVSGCLFTSLLLILVGGSFDELAVDEGGAGTDERDEVGCIHASATGSGLTRSA